MNLWYNAMILNAWNTFLFSANLKSQISSWEEENMQDAGILIRDLSSFPKTIIMGDLNSSPSIPDKQIQGDFESKVTTSFLFKYVFPEIFFKICMSRS